MAFGNMKYEELLEMAPNMTEQNIIEEMYLI